MELYNTIIRGVEGLAGSSAPRRFAYDPAEARRQLHLRHHFPRFGSAG